MNDVDNLDVCISKYYDLIEPAKSAVYSSCKECGEPYSFITHVNVTHVIKHERDRSKDNSELR